MRLKKLLHIKANIMLHSGSSQREVKKNIHKKIIHDEIYAKASIDTGEDIYNVTKRSQANSFTTKTDGRNHILGIKNNSPC